MLIVLVYSNRILFDFIFRTQYPYFSVVDFCSTFFFNSLSTFVYLHFYNYHHQSVCKQNFTNGFLMITFVNLENRLFAIACPFGGENRRILSVYKCLIINKMRFNIHLLFSLMCSFFIFYYGFYAKSSSFGVPFLGGWHSKKRLEMLGWCFMSSV